MPNKKEQIIKSLQNNFNNLIIKSDNNQIIIQADLLNGKIVTDLMLTALALYFVVSVTYKPIYLIPIIVLFLVIVYVTIWIDFNSINTITIDFFANTINLKSRSIIRKFISEHILKQISEYSFKEIQSFSIDSNGSWRASELRYFVCLKLNNGATVQIISFSKKALAIAFLEALTPLLSKNVK